MKTKKIDYIEFIENNTIDCDISYRGGTLKVDVGELFPNVENAVMGAYQNYLGGGIAGSIVGAAQFEPSELSKKDQVTFYELKEVIKKYFYDLNQGGGDDYMVENVNSYKKNQNLPIISGY
jgi:hypothetical protein